MSFVVQLPVSWRGRTRDNWSTASQVRTQARAQENESVFHKNHRACQQFTVSRFTCDYSPPFTEVRANCSSRKTAAADTYLYSLFQCGKLRTRGKCGGEQKNLPSPCSQEFLITSECTGSAAPPPAGCSCKFVVGALFGSKATSAAGLSLRDATSATDLSSGADIAP